jgi:hypothetical protein
MAAWRRHKMADAFTTQAPAFDGLGMFHGGDDGYTDK